MQGLNMDSGWKQTTEWEDLFQDLIIKAKDCPALSLCENNNLTPSRIEDAAGNHVFDDYPEFWEITQAQGHEIRAVFQRFSVRKDQEFNKYIQKLIDSAYEKKWEKERIKKV